MADAVSPEEEVIRAGHAKEVFDSAIFREARTHIANQIQAQMAAAPIGDQALHTRLIMMLQLWNALERWLEQTIQTGTFADVEIQRRRKVVDFFRR